MKTTILKALPMAVVALALLAGLAIFSGSDSVSAADTDVTVSDFYFVAPACQVDLPEDGVSDLSPGCTTTIDVGDTVIWGGAAGWTNFHTVTGCADLAAIQANGPCAGTGPIGDSGVLGGGSSYATTFNTAGTYYYKCNLHASNMIGKVVVVDAPPPPPDVDGPATSSVAATPNPTDGASVVALTATVDDTGLGDSNIDAAEYFIDAVGADGTGTPMAASNGAFNEISEGVTVNINAGALSLGDHTLYVHGKDAADNWGATDSVILSVTETPAGAVTASVSVLGGSLFIEASAVDMGVLTLTGQSQLIEAAADHWHAGDATGTGNGWNVTISSSEFLSGANTIPVDGTDNFKVMIDEDHIMIEDGNAPPSSTVQTYQPLASAPLTVLSAAVDEGMGEYHFESEFSLNVPAETYAGDYEALLTVSINSGP